MLNSSLRRVVRAHPTSLPFRPGSASSAGTYSVAAAFTTRSHQRRNSSSKPPTPPNNGSHPVPPASVKHVGAPKSTSQQGEKRSASDSRIKGKRVTKAERTDAAIKQQPVQQQDEDEYDNEWVMGLPRVPSTQHLNPKDVYVASFFSTHRPISITGPLPPETQDLEIDKIFAPKPKHSPKKTTEVMYTLSSAVDTLNQAVEESAQSPEEQQQQAEQVRSRAEMIKALTQSNNNAQSSDPTKSLQSNKSNSNIQVIHLDSRGNRIRPPTQTTQSQPGQFRAMIQELARQYRPFQTPPPPVPIPDFMESDSAENQPAIIVVGKKKPKSPGFQKAEDAIKAAHESRATQSEEEQLENDQARILEFEIVQQDPSHSRLLTAKQAEELSKSLSGKQQRPHTHGEFRPTKPSRFFTASPAYHITDKVTVRHHKSYPFDPSTSQGRSRRGVFLTGDLKMLGLSRQSRVRRASILPQTDGMLLISVKRQRRLKMKKHKYKKLQRKTRNLRRRQGKI